MTSTPRISVILTSFNHALFLREAIDSVLNQTFQDFELIIWDDASKDNSWDIIQSYNDPRIKSFRNDEQRRGVYGLNKAISEVALGEFIAIHHSDDVWEEKKLEKQFDIFTQCPDIGAVFTWVQIIDENGYKLDLDWFNRPYNRWQLLRELFSGENHLNHPSALVRKSCYDSVGLYKFGLAQTADAEMWSRLLLQHNAAVVEERLVKHRFFSDGSNTSSLSNNNKIRAQNEWYILRCNFLNCKKFEDLLQIFPEISEVCSEKDFSIVRALAYVSLTPNMPRSAWGFGINILYHEITNTVHSSALCNKYDYRNLLIESGLFDVYSILPDTKTNNLKKHIDEQNEQIDLQEKYIDTLVQSRSWRWTKPLRLIEQHTQQIIQQLRDVLNAKRDRNI
ncbi:glycosyltransferase [Desulfobulbus oligotrophicus]|uniref:Glycosyltransferase n=1 Tax=Desulfobulbus oligotrophicus TaxID=1909699 RepID=A0A7T6AR70_9BACT|nr:glycosyltransferase [Desulfobulbus oligotrophicus]QQG66486.1 glycosyltransferase [Desulfobulbus oligotrophicus]